MFVKRAYKFRIYNSKKNRKLEQLLGIACSVYNHCIALQKRYYRLFKKNITAFTMSKHLAKLKKLERFHFLTRLNSQTVQDISERVWRSYKSFFSNVKENKRMRPPRFCKRENYKSFTYKQSGYKFDGNTVTLQKKLRIKFCKSREMEGTVKTVTVKRDGLGDWYLYVVCDVEQYEVLPRKGNATGLDFGLEHFLTTDAGERIESPLFFRQMRNKIQKLNRERSRKVGERKGEKKSKGWLKAQRRLKRAYAQLRHCRDDFQWKLAGELCGRYATICIEDLSLKGMQRLWGRKISDLRFADFVKKLEHMAAKCGCRVVKVDRFFASSQKCSVCGMVNPDTKDLRVRRWVCPGCGTAHDRDVNAARNILSEGLRISEAV